jgi:hypothetical protein
MLHFCEVKVNQILAEPLKLHKLLQILLDE